MNNGVLDNKAKNRFELCVSGETAFADYTRNGDLLTLLYVEAPAVLRGTGAAGKLMQSIMEHAAVEKLKVKPICSYAASWIQRHADFQALLA